MTFTYLLTETDCRKRLNSCSSHWWSWCQATDHECISPEDQWPIRALQHNHRDASLTLGCRTPDRLRPVRMDADIHLQCGSQSIHGQDTSQLSVVLSVTSLTGSKPRQHYLIQYVGAGTTRFFRNRFVHQLCVLWKETDGNHRTARAATCTSLADLSDKCCHSAWDNLSLVTFLGVDEWISTLGERISKTLVLKTVGPFPAKTATPDTIRMGEDTKCSIPGQRGAGHWQPQMY